MNKKLYIYGDSFSTNFSSFEAIEKEKTWSYLLKEELNLEIVDQAYSGISNQGLLQMVYRSLNVEDSEFIVFGLTFFNRIYDFYINGGVDLRMGDEALLELGIKDYEIEFYKKRSLDEQGYKACLQQQLEQFHFLFRTLKSMNKKFVFWCLDETENDWYKKLINDFSEEFIPSPVGTNNWFKPFIDKTPEWWQINNDRHFGENGHKEFFQYLYGYIQPKLI